MNAPRLPSPRNMKAAALVFLALLVSPAAFAAGSQLYGDNCAYCHGGKGKGDGPNAAKLKTKPPDLTKSKSSKDVIAGVVRDGKHACPSWKGSMSEEDIQAVSAYAKSLQE